MRCDVLRLLLAFAAELAVADAEQARFWSGQWDLAPRALPGLPGFATKSGLLVSQQG